MGSAGGTSIISIASPNAPLTGSNPNLAAEPSPYLSSTTPPPPATIAPCCSSAAVGQPCPFISITSTTNTITAASELSSCSSRSVKASAQSTLVSPMSTAPLEIGKLVRGSQLPRASPSAALLQTVDFVQQTPAAVSSVPCAYAPSEYFYYYTCPSMRQEEADRALSPASSSER